MRCALAILLPAFVLCCGTSSGESPGGAGSSSPGSSSGTTTAPPSNPFEGGVAATKVVIEIDYQAGAEPFTGSQPLLGDPWKLFEANATKLFEGTGKTVEVPSTLDRMQKLDDITGESFDAEAILDIAKRHRGTVTGGDTIAYYFVWLDGTFRENGAAKDTVLGVSLGNTGVVAMFKPVIKSSGPVLLTNLDAAVEQTVLVHEFGHAVGLVNNGVPLASQHQDEAHGKHCTNPDCVMYWTVEGAEAAREYARRRITGASNILFAEDCLADIRASK